MMKRECISRPGIVFLIITLLCFAYSYCSPALAQYQSDDLIDITVQSGTYTTEGTFITQYTGSCPINPGMFNSMFNRGDYWGQVYSSHAPVPWNLTDIFPGGMDIAAENHSDIILAHIDGLSIQYQGDPIANLGFSVTAGAYATIFSFSSPLMTFDPLSNTEAYAEAGISVTGGTLYGSYSGGTKAYKALYNNNTIPFAYLVNTPITSYSGGNTGAMAPLPGSITSIQSKFQFILSAGATANGSSYYEVETVIPEPATMALLGLGGLALLRKRMA